MRSTQHQQLAPPDMQRTERQSEATRHFFDREAPDWSGQYRPGGTMADRAERFRSALRDRLPAGDPVLDLGCGSGEISAALAAAGWRVTGTDPSRAMLAAARRHGDAVDWVHLATPDRGLPFAPGRFAAVIASSVLEYVGDLPACLAEIARVLRPGGWLLATVPDMSHPARAAEVRKRQLALNPVLFSLLRLTPWRSTYEYLRLSINRLPLDEWLALLRAAGFTAEIAAAEAHPLALLIAERRGADA
jgi:SAM-dependent methyltransferase